MSVPVYVLTSERYLWTLPPFAYLFNTYWSELQDVTVVTDVKPGFSLPSNFKLRSMNGNDPLPAERWSDGVIVMLKHIPESHFVLLLEDYWLVRTVDHHGIQTLAEYARMHPEILRVDLTDDRFFAGDRQDIGAWGHYDLVETPNDSPYQLSLQAGIWSRDLMLSIMRPGLSPWQVELEISPALAERDDLRVIGTRQCPIRYANVLKGGDSEKALNLERIPQEHRDEIRRRGWLPASV